MHMAVNMFGARHRCSVVRMLGPPSLAALAWRLVAACAPFTFIPRDAIPCLIFQIDKFESLGAILI